MKIRHPLLTKTFGWLGAWAIRGLVGTVRYHYYPLGPNLEPSHLPNGEHVIYAFWHEYLLLLAYQYRWSEVSVLVSQHADGEMIAQACRQLGLQTIRGSSTRGGVESVLRMLRTERKGHLAITPDGPRGPRRQVQLGVAYLASRSGLPIVPAGLAFRKPWRATSWDRFAVPRPGSAGVCVTDTPIHVPANLNRHDLEHYRQQIEQDLTRLTEMAERLAEQPGDISIRDVA